MMRKGHRLLVILALLYDQFSPRLGERLQGRERRAIPNAKHFIAIPSAGIEIQL
jgi:hypothetical protein